MVDGEDASVSAILAVVDGHLFQAIGERQRTRILSRSKEDESLSSAQLETWQFHVNSLNFNSILLSANASLFFKRNGSNVRPSEKSAGHRMNASGRPTPAIHSARTGR